MRGLLRSGGMGFLVAVAVSLLVIGGLWAVARTGPSAKSARAPMVAPTPTPTPEEGGGRLGQTPFPTSRPIPVQVRSISARTPAPAAPGWGLPRRRSALPTPTGWELLVGSVRDGDATGADPGAVRSVGALIRALPQRRRARVPPLAARRRSGRPSAGGAAPRIPLGTAAADRFEEIVAIGGHRYRLGP